MYICQAVLLLFLFRYFSAKKKQGIDFAFFSSANKILLKKIVTFSIKKSALFVSPEFFAGQSRLRDQLIKNYFLMDQLKG